MGELAVITEVNRRLTDRGYAPVPQAVLDAAAQADEQSAPTATRPANTGPRTLSGDVSNVRRELGGTIRQQTGEIVGAANRFQNYVLGNPTTAPSTARAAPAPTTIDPTITRDMSYRKLLQGGLTPEQEVAEFDSLTRRYGVNASDLARFLQEQRGR